MMPRPELALGDTAQSLERAMIRLGEFVRRVALKAARKDVDVAEDMYQEAMIRLWEMDPARFDERDLKYLGKALLNRMLDYRRNASGHMRQRQRS